MKAILCPKYGSPDVLQLAEVAIPQPKDDQVPVKVYAASVNPVDWHSMRGEPFMVRLMNGLFKPKDPRIGGDMAGRVEAVGSQVTAFKPGDEVFGVGPGAFAEYALAREVRLAHKPTNLSFDLSAAIPVAACTALLGLRNRGQVQRGQKVLINGASGGVGTFAVQIATAFGAEVTGVCSTRNLEMVRSIGAVDVIDYTREDFARSGQRYDLIYDTVGNRPISDYQRALHPQGKCVIVGFGGLRRMAEYMLFGPRVSKPGGQQIGLQGLASVQQNDLFILKELIETGKVIPVFDRTYPLEKAADAVRYLEQGHAAGKVVINIQEAR